MASPPHATPSSASPYARREEDTRKPRTVLVVAKRAITMRSMKEPGQALEAASAIGALLAPSSSQLISLTDYLPSVTGWRLSFGGQEYQVIDLVGKTASLAVLLAFLLVNSSVVALRRRKDLKRHFRVPLNIGDFPLLPVLANVLIVFFVALSFGDWIVWLSTIIVALLGLVMYKPRRNGS